jgi:hypothetical protein
MSTDVLHAILLQLPLVDRLPAALAAKALWESSAGLLECLVPPPAAGPGTRGSPVVWKVYSKVSPKLTAKGKPKAMKDCVVAGGGTGSFADSPTRWLGTNHVRGLKLEEPIEISGGHTTLIGCHILSGIGVRPGASLTLVGCTVSPPHKQSAQVVAAVRLGKLTQLVAQNCVFSPRDAYLLT